MFTDFAPRQAPLYLNPMYPRFNTGVCVPAGCFCLLNNTCWPAPWEWLAQGFFCLIRTRRCRNNFCYLQVRIMRIKSIYKIKHEAYKDKLSLMIVLFEKNSPLQCLNICSKCQFFLCFCEIILTFLVDLQFLNARFP